MPVSSRAAAGGAARFLRPAVTAVTLGVALGWAFWATIVGLWDDWRDDPNYSVGQLVPLAALYVLWDDRRGLRACRVGACWWGLALMVVGQLLRFFGLLFLYQSAERYALVLTLAGLVLLVAGPQVFWRMRWVLAFVLLMVPLPGRIHNVVSGPLQRCATSGTVFVLEVLGADVTRAGNVLLLGEDTSVGIAEACSGLRMLTAFVVVSAVLAFVVERPRWQRAVLLASSIPIAIACNIVRLIATVGLYVLIDSSTAEHFFHDFAGVTMMPLAIAVLIGELWLMQKLVAPDAAPARQQSAD
jgi:exosortase